jgi:hypothetical protein
MLNLFNRTGRSNSPKATRSSGSFFTDRSRKYLEQTAEEAADLTDECLGIVHLEDHRDGIIWTCQKMKAQGFSHHKTRKHDKNGDICCEDPTQTREIQDFWKMEQY